MKRSTGLSAHAGSATSGMAGLRTGWRLHHVLPLADDGRPVGVVGRRPAGGRAGRGRRSRPSAPGRRPARPASFLSGGIFRSVVGVAHGADEQALVRLAGDDGRAGVAARRAGRRGSRGAARPSASSAPWQRVALLDQDGPDAGLEEGKPVRRAGGGGEARRRGDSKEAAISRPGYRGVEPCKGPDRIEWRAGSVSDRSDEVPNCVPPGQTGRTAHDAGSPVGEQRPYRRWASEVFFQLLQLVDDAVEPPGDVGRAAGTGPRRGAHPARVPGRPEPRSTGRPPGPIRGVRTGRKPLLKPSWPVRAARGPPPKSPGRRYRPDRARGPPRSPRGPSFGAEASARCIRARPRLQPP